jgi:hypothetical protein
LLCDGKRIFLQKIFVPVGFRGSTELCSSVGCVNM